MGFRRYSTDVLGPGPDAIKVDSIPMSDEFPEGVMEICFDIGSALVWEVMGKDNKRRYCMAQAQKR